MNIKRAKEEIIHTVQAYTAKTKSGVYRIPSMRQRPVLLIGPPGIGKTAIVSQAAKICHVGFVAYTITHHTRQSAVGLPVITKRSFDGFPYDVTEYTMSEIIGSIYTCMEETGCREGILFIDEINCVSETLLPTMLQLLQGKKFGEYAVPEGWVIVTAGNPYVYNRSVREFDMVTLDRVKRIEIEPDYPVWRAYANDHRLHGSILFYLECQRDRFYYTEREGQKLSFVTARGWEDLSVILYAYEEAGIAVDKELIIQYLQCESIAGEFYNWYQLYTSYGKDFDTLYFSGKEADPEMIQRAAKAGWEETCGLIRYGFSQIAEKTNQWSENRRLEKLRREKADRFLSYMKRPNEEPTETKAFSFTEQQKKALAVKKQAKILTEEEIRNEQEGLFILEEIYQYGLMRHAADTASFESCTEQYLSEHETADAAYAKEASEKIHGILSFFHAAFAEEAESEYLQFLQALSEHAETVLFFREYPEQLYESYLPKLILADEEEQLRREIAQFS